MNQAFGQFAVHDSLSLPSGVSAPAASAPRAFAAGNAEQPLLRLDLRRSLQMHRRLALGFALAGLLLAVAYLFKSWSIYTAQSLVYIQPTPSAVLQGAAPMHWPYNYDPATYDSYIQQQMLSMTRPDVLAGALHKLQPGVWQQSGESDQSAAARLKGAIEVARVGTSYQVAITAHAANPDAAAALANAVAASYIEDTSHEQKAGDAERLAMLRDESERVKKELTDDRAEQTALNMQLGVAAIGPEAPEHYDSDIGQIHDELVKARADQDEAAARLTSINADNGLSSAALDAAADQMIATDPGLASLKTALLQRRAALVSQMANLTPNHPEYKQDTAELAQIDASLNSATQDLRAKAAARIEEQMRMDIDRTADVESRLNAQLKQMTSAAASVTPKLQRSSDLANDIARLQNRYSTVDDQLQNLLLEDSAPGTAHLAAAAAAPLHPADVGVIRNAILLLLIFIVLGIVAAVAAHKMDPRIYIASDVEHLLGCAPMAQLPDFTEVPGEVAGEHLLRLAAGIEHACKESGLRSCIFTGASPGAGVTTVAARVREMLGGLGRTAMLVDALGNAPAAVRAGLGQNQDQAQAAAQRAMRPAALLQQAAEQAETGRESLVLTDTAPLTVSAETEYLARFADCTIVVIESGVTTRAQLRAAADRLRRLDAAAVGFVLNRVGLAKANPAFRHAVREEEMHLRAQGRPIAWRTDDSLHIAAEVLRANAELEAPVASATADLRPAPLAPPARQEIKPLLSPESKPAPPPADIPWWLTEAPAHSDTLLTRPRKPRAGSWHAILTDSDNHEPPAEEPRQVALEEAPPAPARLSGLRSLLLSLGVKELNQAKRPAPQAEPEPQPPAEDAAPERNLAPAPAPERPESARTFVPYPESELAPAAAASGENGSRRDTPHWVTAEPEFLPPKLVTPGKDRESRWGNGAVTRRDRRDAYDEVQTLPSWRGQYKRKD